MQNIHLEPAGKLSSYRKISISSWRHPRDPSTYSSMDLPVAAAEAFLKSYPSETPLTLTHYIAKVLAHCYQKIPQFNQFLRRGKLQQRKFVDVFITTLVRTADGKDLSGFIIRDVPGKPLPEIGSICNQRVDQLRKGNDPEIESAMRIINKLPSGILRWVLHFQDFIQHSLNCSLNWLGFPRDPFGSVTISNIGALGLEQGYIPLSPYTRCSSIIGIGKVREIPIVRDGRVIAARCVNISFTFDHRYADGAHGAQVLRRFQKIFLNPEAYPQIFEAESTGETAATESG